jgi:hypothetical protein
MTPLSIDEYREFYFSTFLPAYADLTGYTLQKHEVILYSIDSANSHLMQYLSPEIGEDIRNQNLIKAKGHLERATLDCYKLLWLHLEEDLKSLITDSEKRVLCVNMDEGDLLKKYREAVDGVVQSRRVELQNVGLDLEATIEKYHSAIQLTKEIMENIDPIALDLIDRKRSRNRWIELGIALVIGIIGTIISTPIVGFIFHTN